MPETYAPLEPGDAAPAFDMPTNGGGRARLEDFAGRYLVFYFYPKDDTPGCTKEAIAFSGHRNAFEDRNTAILGVSKDSASKHDAFVSKHDLTIRLAADESGEVCERYGVWVEKKMYGRTYMGVERTTFLIAPDGRIEKIWRKVKVPGHAETVLHTLDPQ